ncbi:copper-binding protein [Comamonas sp. J-3]|uniref:copper-binding protein n=1 Tax=Comamonas trifloxystrobinivorans TaxID=3350256 RepID=UPI0037287476
MQHLIPNSIATLCLSLALAAPALAQDHSAHAGHGAAAASSAPAAAPATSSTEAVMTAGEITRVDARSGKLTIRHEDIQNLNMPAMTMVFSLKDATQAQAAQYKAGDKVRFHAEDNNGALVITQIELAK